MPWDCRNLEERPFWIHCEWKQTQGRCGKCQKRYGTRQARDRKTAPDRQSVSQYTGAAWSSAGTSTWGRLGVKVTVLGRGQVRGGLLHGLYPGIVVAHQNALKGLAKTPCAGPTHQVLIQAVWGVV